MPERIDDLVDRWSGDSSPSRGLRRARTHTEKSPEPGRAAAVSDDR
jgi:hypothetical protein